MRKFISVVLGMTCVVAGMIATTGAANAASEADAFECTTGRLCTWDSPEGTGSPHYNFQSGARNLEDLNYNDKISSVHNLSGRVFCLYEHLSGKGRSLAISRNYRSAIPAKYNFNNITSSIGPANGAGVCDGTVPGEG